MNGYYLSGKKCVSCGANSIYNGVSCVCNNGYYLINNACTACGSNQVWNGTNCVCANGFYLIGGICQTCPSGNYWNGTDCVPICPTKAVWNGNACVCMSGFYQIQGACLPCDTNSVYDGQTCNCKAGFFGNYQLCTACDFSCVTCSKAGTNGCTSCPTGITLNQGTCVAGCGVGKVLQGGVCVNCPNSCISCSDAYTCTQCAQNYTLLQQIIGNNSVIGCTLPGTSSPGSKLALTGIVVGNGVIYQGVTLSTLPSYFLTTNCADCSDLFTVLIIPNNLGITYSIQYVLYSQYWFIITFSFSSGITPTFQFKVQLNFKYANYFTSADMAQGLLNSVSSLQYPTTPSTNPTSSNTTNTNLPSGITPRPPGTVYTSAGNPTSQDSITPKPSQTTTTPTSNTTTSSTRTVVQNGVTSSVNTNTLVSLFGGN